MTSRRVQRLMIHGPRIGALPGALAALLLVSAISHSASADTGNTKLIDGVTAVVGDSVILHSEVMMRAGPMLADAQGISDPQERERRKTVVKEHVLDEMIQEELLVQAAAQANVEVSDHEIDRAVQEVMEQNDLSEEEFEEALGMQGYTMRAYRHDLERQMLRMRAAEMIVRPRVNVSEEDVRDRYEEMQHQQGGIGRVRLSHIMLEVPADASDEEAAAVRQRAAELAERARGDEAFAELAEEYSDDIASRADGGSLGWVERGSLATAWEDRVFALEEGEVSEPMEGPNGIHVFHVQEREEQAMPAYEEQADSIREELYRAEMERETERFLDDLRDRVHVEIRLES